MTWTPCYCRGCASEGQYESGPDCIYLDTNRDTYRPWEESEGDNTGW